MMETKQVERRAGQAGPNGGPLPHTEQRWPAGKALADQAGLPADAAPLKLQPGPALAARKIAKIRPPFTAAAAAACFRSRRRRQAVLVCR